MKQDLNIRGRLVDIHQERIYRATLTISGGKITYIEELDGPGDEYEPFICQGFIDAHVHIESSMLVPSEFARLAVVHGTIATISDPHEIANVCGMQGVKYMIRNGNKCPFISISAHLPAYRPPPSRQLAQPSLPMKWLNC